jgi:hypothetical protein
VRNASRSSSACLSAPSSSRSVKPTPNSNCICLRVAPCCDSALASRML